MSDTISLGFKLTGESDFKRALTDINNALKVNASELSLVSAKYSENGKSAESLTEKNKLLQNSLGTEQEKIKTLESAIEKSTSAHISAGTQIEKLKNDLAAAKAKMDEMSRSTDVSKSDLLAQQAVIKNLTKDLNAAEKAYVSTGKSTTKWSTDLNNAKANVININRQLSENQNTLQKSSTDTGKLGNAITSIANAAGISVPPALDGMISKLNGTSASGAALIGVLGGIATALVKNTIHTAQAADEIDVLSKKTGLSTDAIQELNYSSELLDVNTETINGALGKLTKSMNASKEKTSDQAKAFKQLHISAHDTNGQLRDAHDIFLMSIDALGKIKNETDRDALAMTIFGKSARELNPLIEAGSGKLKELSGEAHKVGAVMSGETIDKFNQMKDAMDRMDQQSEALKLSFAGALLPVLTDLFEAIGKIPTPVLQMIIVLAGIITTIVLLVKAIKDVTDTGSALKTFFGGFNQQSIRTAALIMGVVVALIALAGIIAVIMGKSSELDASMSSIGNSVGRINNQVSNRQRSVSSSVPRYATGTTYHPGGPAILHDGAGPEIYDLPTGTRVYPHGTNPQIGGDTFNITINPKDVQEFNDIVRIAKDARSRRIRG